MFKFRLCFLLLIVSYSSAVLDSKCYFFLELLCFPHIFYCVVIFYWSILLIIYNISNLFYLCLHLEKNWVGFIKNRLWTHPKSIKYFSISIVKLVWMHLSVWKKPGNPLALGVPSLRAQGIFTIESLAWLQTSNRYFFKNLLFFNT